MSSAFSIDALYASLSNLVEDPENGRYCIAFSGGIDSSALLYGWRELRRRHPALQVRALHVNHHLHTDAAAWAAHCAHMAGALEVPFQVLDARIATGAGISMEAAAREARYALLRAELRDDELLLTAHHQDDQLETLLLQLLRGSGVAGLAAMPARAAFGRGWHLRPLLGVTRSALEQFLRGAGQAWIEDSSNANLRHDRNFLRHRLLPLLRERWPGAAPSVARSATHLAEAQLLLNELAQSDLAEAHEGDTLRLTALRALQAPRARNLLRYWIRSAGYIPPPAARLQEILKQMLEARADAVPCVKWEGAEVRRYRDRLYVLGPLPSAPQEERIWDWRSDPRLDLGAGLGQLQLRPAGPGDPALCGLPCPLHVTWRNGVRALRPDATGARHTLRNLFQQQGIVPWMRARVPLIFTGERLAAVADRWHDAAYRAVAAAPAFVLEWHGHPDVC
jgi:tRNA(Ile)-lysidine synthase